MKTLASDCPSRPMARCSLVLIASLLLGCMRAVASPPGPQASSASIPLKGAGVFGSTLSMQAEVFKPIGAGPFPVMIYAHGRSGTSQERGALREVIPRQYLDFWVSRGFAAVGVARPGYGLTGGMDPEQPGHTWEPSGSCRGVMYPERVAEAAGSAITAVLGWVRQQPWAKPGSVLITGNSVGGMTSVLMGSKAPEGVVGVINFAGGVGGNPNLAPNRSCMPERLTEYFGKLGGTSKVPSLWIYAQNDLFWGPEAPKSWYAAFTAAGAENSSFTMTSAVTAPDGHYLIFVGKALWEPHVEAFLKRLGM